jgi:aminoglycoside N3'-acetyltransferase
MTGVQRLNEILDRLKILGGDVVYLHTSFKRMAYLNLSPEQFIATIIDRLGERGTLVLPSFAWNLDKSARPWKGYDDYFRTRPILDIKNTPANIGVIPELFRKMPLVQRSLNYWWPICARGPLAAELVAGQDQITHPYGPGSSFDLLRMNDVKILGLGVSLNTTSLAPVADYALDGEHPHRVFTDEPQKGMVIDEDGKLRETYSFWLLPEVVRLIKPGDLITESTELHDAVLRADQDDNINFAYPYNVYHREALRLGRVAGAEGSAVPWLKNYPLHDQGERKTV